MRKRLQVLPEREHIGIMCAQVAHDVDDLVVGFAKAEHETGFGGLVVM